MFSEITSNTTSFGRTTASSITSDVKITTTTFLIESTEDIRDLKNKKILEISVKFFREFISDFNNISSAASESLKVDFEIIVSFYYLFF
jgi:hypothetical protein